MRELPAPGDVFESGTIPVSFAKMLAFSGGPFDTPGWPLRNIHTDYEKAREAGIPVPIASGIQAESHLVRLLEGAFGDAWFRTGMLDVKHVRPLAAGDAFALKARVAERRQLGEGTTRYVLEVSGARPDGTLVLTGTAEVSVER